jgi:UDP-N-acetylmuramate--alanine ligase
MMVPAPDKVLPAEQLGRVHFVGIGGVGMSSIARIMLGRGLPVSGSDVKETRMLAALRALGADIHLSQAPENLEGVDTVVVSTAIREENVEVVEARRRGLRIVHRASALASLMDGYCSVAVAGTHGKTTTTSMLTVALQSCGADPSFAIGGQLNESGTNGHAGSGDVFVAEADESDGTFLYYAPSVAIVTNVELDHADYYGSLEDVHAAFEKFVDRIDPAGFLVTCADDPGAARLAEVARARGVDVRTYGTDPSADVRITDLWLKDGYASFDLVVHGTRAGQLDLRVPGTHNARNAAAAFAAGFGLDQPADRLLHGLAQFSGARRRMELKGEARGVRVFDDYMHHPTEVRVMMDAYRAIAGGGRLLVVFQPHRYSRTQAFLHEFGPALGGADAVVVMGVYGSGEEPIPGVSGAVIAADVPLPAGQVIYEPSWSAVAGRVAELARPGDLVVTAGPGDVTMIGPELLAKLRGDDEQDDADA